MAHLLDELETPQFSLPFRIEGGSVTCHEQDSAEDHLQNAVVVLRYQHGKRSAKPEFGIPNPVLHENGISLGELVNAVARYEPDVDVNIVRSLIDENGEDIIHINLEANDG